MKKIAFVGNPNVGKSALINEVAGAKLKVGNWPGVTVEKKDATMKINGETVYIVDLPGVYSLNPHSIEEEITARYLLEEKIDLIINVIDSTNLERNLYLTAQLKEINKPMVLALNFHDEFDKLGYQLNKPAFEEYLGVRSCYTSATSNIGIEDLRRYIAEGVSDKKAKSHLLYEIDFENTIEDIIYEIKEKILVEKNSEKLLKDNNIDYVAIKTLEDDYFFYGYAKEKYKIDLEELGREYRAKLEQILDDDPDTIIAKARYGIAKGVVRKTLKKSMKSRLDFTDKIDKFLLNETFGLFIFFGILVGVFSLTFNGSEPFIDWVDGFISDYVGGTIERLVEGTPHWLHSLVMEGIIGGVGGVLVFVPLMMFLFFFMAILEESGYMSRVAFLMDKVMKKIGLNGKAFVPLILGFGCSVPAIYATRTLEDEKSRRLTAIMAPFMSCGARLPVYALFTAAFFPNSTGIIVLILYLTGIFVAIFTGFVLKKNPYFATDEKALLIELPPYRIPSAKMILRSTFSRTMSYIQKATTVIMGILVLLWVLTYFPNNGDAKNSFLGYTARVIKPIMAPVGFADRWETVAAIPPSIAAKEVVVGFMAQVLLDEKDDEILDEETLSFGDQTKEQIIGFGNAARDSVMSMISFDIRKLFSPPSAEEFEEESEGVVSAVGNLWEDDEEGPLKAFSFMIFILLVIPCAVTLAAIKQELGTKMMFMSIGIMTIIPYVASTLVYQIGRLFF